MHLAWTQPSTPDCRKCLIRYSTSGYPATAASGSLAVDDVGAPNSDRTYDHTSLTAGVTYYYSAFTNDGIPNYSTAVHASATPTAPARETIYTCPFNVGTGGWTTVGWKAGTESNGTMAWSSTGGNSGGCMVSTGYSSTDNDDTCKREGGEIYKVISTAGYTDIQVTCDVKTNSLGGNYTGSGSGSCTVDHSLIDEQLTPKYTTNGGTSWSGGLGYLKRSNLLADYQSYAQYAIDLSSFSSCNNNANFGMRFRWQFNTASDTGYLDNIKVTGIPQ